ncbi:hypothetical protein SAMN05421504_105512 [Amycolatopsis xylanica]|uniref:Sporulation and spore germination n=1 Tax=Amycolatopsis xylanica TaxID=589385 RepID=A0A1H3JR26_9PSEU|nr:hypothetical protein [Amycolatopsis xylanica]SDY42376.1 hypothetical protein SAMN05421504_105512 [Amycolatopsis xylanica]
MKRLVLALALLISGCGIQATGAVPMGPAPTYVPRGATSGPTPADLVLFFVVDGHIQGVARPSDGRNSLANSLALLFKGPNAEDTKRGMVTFLPAYSGSIGYEMADTLNVKLPFPLKGVPALGLSQIACTALTALNVSGAGNVRPDVVTLTGSEGAPLQRGCDG